MDKWFEDKSKNYKVRKTKKGKYKDPYEDRLEGSGYFSKVRSFPEWRKVSIAFACGTLFGVCVVKWIIPFLVGFA